VIHVDLLSVGILSFLLFLLPHLGQACADQHRQSILKGQWQSELFYEIASDCVRVVALTHSDCLASAAQFYVYLESRLDRNYIVRFRNSESDVLFEFGWKVYKYGFG
jgi:hypothetical protein